ncbi:MAG: hypothetical protein FJZ95_00235 [Chloroflexi bacterium]|nr:hypothetical protein [Chloroflexota bacterium]
MNDIQEALPLFIPIALIHLILLFFAIRDLARRKEKGPVFKGIWGILATGIVVTGPLAYFMWARGEKSWSLKVLEAQQRMQQDAQADRDKNDK